MKRIRVTKATKQTRVKIKYAGKPDPSYVSRSGAPIGQLASHGRIGRIMGNSPKYNSSFIVAFLNPCQVFDIHDQHFDYQPCICSTLALHQNGCKCGGI